ncbi:endolytic transglycosylase MltG [Streptomyces sp. NPDC002537]
MTESGRDPGDRSWHPEDPLYGGQGYDGQQYPQQSRAPYGQEQQPYGWDPSQGAGGSYAGDPYGQQPAEPYGGGYQDYYASQGSYAQQPQGAPRQQEHVPQQEAQHTTQSFERPPEWRSEPDEEKLSLFDDADKPREERSRSRGRRGKDKKGKRRGGTACLIVAVILLGALGGVGYLAYDCWQTYFGTPPDYEGEGSGRVQVEIPKGSSLTQMGQDLQQADVVKSVRAFTGAAAKKAIQPGSYTLRKEMSGKAAVAMMTNTSNFLVVPEGSRAVAVYAAIDEKLGLPKGTTKDVAKNQAKNLGLPDWADSDPKIKDPLEGFLYPSQYNASKGIKPEDVLKRMVARAKENYAKVDLEGKAKELNLTSPFQVITVASLVQAEGKTHDDFRKMARVIYNRLKPDNRETGRKLQFDSTYNYVKNQSEINPSREKIKTTNDPYNTDFYPGLPPGPIDNPGPEALRAALDPESGSWMYFVSVDGHTTQFVTTYAEEQKLDREFKNNQKKKKSG